VVGTEDAKMDIRVELCGIGVPPIRVFKGRMEGDDIPGIWVFDGRRGDDGKSPTWLFCVGNDGKAAADLFSEREGCESDTRRPP